MNEIWHSPTIVRTLKPVDRFSMKCKFCGKRFAHFVLSNAIDCGEVVEGEVPCCVMCLPNHCWCEKT